MNVAGEDTRESGTDLNASSLVPLFLLRDFFKGTEVGTKGVTLFGTANSAVCNSHCSSWFRLAKGLAERREVAKIKW